MSGRNVLGTTSCMLMVLLFAAFDNLQAQAPRPVKWRFEVRSLAAGMAELVFKASIDPGYHVYSQHINPDAGPIPTAFVFRPDRKNYVLDGKVAEGVSTEIFDENFGATLNYFSGEAVFTQKIRLKGRGAFNVNGTVTFMVCDDHRCFPPEDLGFSFRVNGQAGAGPGREGSAETPKSQQP